MPTFSKLSLAQKVCMLSFFCLTLPCLIFSIILYNGQMEQFYVQLVKEQSIAVEQVTENLNQTLRSVSELSLDLAYRSPLNAYLNRQYRADVAKFSTWSRQQLADVIASIKYSLKYQNLGVVAANIFFVRGSATESSYFWDAARLDGLDFFEDFRESRESVALYYLNETQSTAFREVRGYSALSASPDTLLLIRRIDSNDTWDCVGYILFECTPSELFPALFSPGRQQGSYYAWFEQHQLGYGATPDEQLALALTAPRESENFVDAANRRYVCRTTAEFGITVVNTEPINRPAIVLPALGVSLVLAILALVQLMVQTVVVRRSFSHLHKDLNTMDEIVAHQFRGRIVITRTDEIGMIACRYNTLLDKINGLVQDLVQKETAHTQMQLKALQHQMNPHFIYNTLSIFSGYAQQHGDSQLAESIASFGHLLRYNIKSDGLYSTVDRELRNASSLINVYSIRYFDRLHLTIDAPPEVRKLKLIKFLLQPLLENSILHGLLPPRTGLNLSIEVHIIDNWLRLRICDDGAGMSPERLAEVQSYLVDTNPPPEPPPSSTGFSVGLRNIWERLRLFYSQQAEMQIDSIEQGGTTIDILIPITQTEE